MSRIVSVMILSAIMLSLALGQAPAAHSEVTTIPLGISYPYVKSDIIVHLMYVEVGDHQMGNTYTTTPLDRVKWFRLFYKFENTGNHTEDGYVKAEFYDEQGNVYKPNEGTYTGDSVRANSMGDLKFIEIPISRDSNIATIRVIQLLDYKDYPIPRLSNGTPTPGPTVTLAPTPSATPSPTSPVSTGSGGSCLPLMPFAILGAVGLVGLTTGKRLIKK